MVENIETVIIGAGHAGLAASYVLKQRGREHIILDKASQAGDSWHSQRWDSFTFISPNWTFRLPGSEYDGPEPDGFMARDEIVDRLGNHAKKYNLPIAYETSVTSILPLNEGYIVKTLEKDYQARNVVVANGWFQSGTRPEFASKIPASVLQIHSSGYHNPQALPPGAVLVVGSGQSGSQIVDELLETGRKVFLATGTAPHAPRWYRGKDIFDWIYASGFADQTFEQMAVFGKAFTAPMLSGKSGGRTLSLHKFQRDGVVLLGHAKDYLGGELIFAPDLKENVTKADMGQKFLLKRIDDYILREKLDAPMEELPSQMDAYKAQEFSSLNLEKEGISTIIWACGYSYDPSIFPFPVLDRFGLPDAPMGASTVHPGLFFIGFPFLPTLSSGFVAGVGKCAAFLGEKVDERRLA